MNDYYRGKLVAIQELLEFCDTKLTKEFDTKSKEREIFRAGYSACKLRIKQELERKQGNLMANDLIKCNL